MGFFTPEASGRAAQERGPSIKKYAEARYDPKQGAHGSAVSFRVGHDIVNGWTSSQCLNVEYEDGHVDVLSYKNAAECSRDPLVCAHGPPAMRVMLFCHK